MLASILLTGCRKNFLDEPQPTQSVTEEDIFRSVKGVQAYFNGIYSKMRQPWVPLGSTTEPSTDNWGYVAISLTRINNGTDFINPGGFYQYDYRLENREPTYRRTIFTWQFFFETINQANIIIKGVTESATIPDDAKPALLAEARALRGWFYFEAIREYQFTIAKDPAAPGIPVYTEPTTLENRGKPRGTIQEVYNQINDDLAFAVANSGTERVYKNSITLPVAYGMQARIMLEQQKWAEAAVAAQNARADFALDRDNYRNGYNKMETSPEVIWGFPQSVTGSAQSVYYGTLSSFYEKTGNGYDNLFLDKDFVEKFSNTDIRNTFFYYSSNPASAARYACNKFGALSGGTVELINGETMEEKTIDFEESLPMMRVAEMILIEAEAKARLGQTQDAKDLLFELQSNRDPAATESANTGQALINEILLERRKELYGELGIDLLDIRRLQLPLVRAGNHPAAYKFNFPANSKELILKLPQREIDTNDFIAPEDQNP